MKQPWIMLSRRWCYKWNCFGDRIFFVALCIEVVFFRLLDRVLGISTNFHSAKRNFRSKWMKNGERNECIFSSKLSFLWFSFKFVLVLTSKDKNEVSNKTCSNCFSSTHYRLPKHIPKCDPPHQFLCVQFSTAGLWNIYSWFRFIYQQKSSTKSNSQKLECIATLLLNSPSVLK